MYFRMTFAAVLFWEGGSRSCRVLWTLKEMGLTNYKLIVLPFPPRLFQKDYLKLNVLGTIPYFVDGETRMTESCSVHPQRAGRIRVVEGCRLGLEEDMSEF